MFGDKQSYNDQGGYPTPESIPETVGTRAFCIPDSTAWYAVVMGCLMQLAEESSWQQFDGGIGPEEAAAAAQDIIDSGYEGTCSTGSSMIPTPFWDDVTETDDQDPVETQPWYGSVLDPDLPADELTFVENAGIWAFTGFLALSGTPAAAILFHTIAPDFVLAMRGDDFAEVIRIIIDAQDYAEIQTTGDPDELVELQVAAGESETGHDILLVLKEILTP